MTHKIELCHFTRAVCGHFIKDLDNKLLGDVVSTTKYTTPRFSGKKCRWSDQEGDEPFVDPGGETKRPCVNRKCSDVDLELTELKRKDDKRFKRLQCKCCWNVFDTNITQLSSWFCSLCKVYLCVECNNKCHR